ncbi:MAG: hypothetical protein JWO58_2391 [Chitinophagaceae bacterium]|nr:hypothetical protein [Chitinophagaceae bacterium]
MKSVSVLSSCLCLLFFIHCTHSSDSTQIDAKDSTYTEHALIANDSTDKANIAQLLREVYNWYETKEYNQAYFDLHEKDSIYTGIDTLALTKKINRWKALNYFAPAFFEEYRSLAQKVDQELKKDKYMLGDIPPYADADLWCNCQDFPNEYWNSLIIKDLVIKDNNASLYWTWSSKEYESGFKYHVKLQKENGQWKVSYLEGLDSSKYESN